MKYIILSLLIASCGKQTVIRKEVHYKRDVVEKVLPTETIIEIETITEQCSVSPDEEGAIIVCPDGTQTILNHGQDGLDIQNYDFIPVGLVDPCGDKPGIYDEVFIRMANNTLVASFSNNVNGDYTRLSVLVAGNYSTTDGDNCSFTVNEEYDIINESHQN